MPAVFLPQPERVEHRAAGGVALVGRHARQSCRRAASRAQAAPRPPSRRAPGVRTISEPVPVKEKEHPLPRPSGAAARFNLIAAGVINLVSWLYGLLIDRSSQANFVPLNTAGNWLHLVPGLGMIALGLIFGRRPPAAGRRPPAGSAVPAVPVRFGRASHGPIAECEEGQPVRGVVMVKPGEVQVTERAEAVIEQPTDAVIRLAASCICGSDLWPYRGANQVDHQVMGHEYVGVVEEIGADVRTVRVGDFVVGSFIASDNTCEICRAGYQAYCVHRVPVGNIGTQAERARIPLADGTLVATPAMPEPGMIPSLLAASDVLGTGWFAAVAAEVTAGKTVAVVGDGAVGLLGVLAASQLGAERIIAVSRHPDRQALAREFGATDIVAERGQDGVDRIKELTGGLGAHSVIEAVGTQQAMMQAIHSTRAGGHVGFVGVSHDVAIPGQELFRAGVHLHGGPAPVRRFLPELIQLIWDGRIEPGRVFDRTLPLAEAAEGYRAMDERRAIKVLLTP
ncbi:MAG TPA: zinc-binding dehydrogenase [Jatrophihabitans sp.]|nr:zinc-binding dehydrogenase [Jatrophihabitans sp.]